MKGCLPSPTMSIQIHLHVVPSISTLGIGNIWHVIYMDCSISLFFFSLSFLYVLYKINPIYLSITPPRKIERERQDNMKQPRLATSSSSSNQTPILILHSPYEPPSAPPGPLHIPPPHPQIPFFLSSPFIGILPFLSFPVLSFLSHFPSSTSHIHTYIHTYHPSNPKKKKKIQ